jgi:hypothetical protein
LVTPQLLVLPIPIDIPFAPANAQEVAFEEVCDGMTLAGMDRE